MLLAQAPHSLLDMDLRVWVVLLVIFFSILNSIAQALKGKNKDAEEREELDFDVSKAPQPPGTSQPPRAPQPPRPHQRPGPQRGEFDRPNAPRPPRSPQRGPQPRPERGPRPAPVSARRIDPQVRMSGPDEAQRLAHEREREAAEALRLQQAELERQRRMQQRAEALQERTKREDHDYARDHQKAYAHADQKTPQRQTLATIDSMISNPNGFATAFVMSEILGPPVGLKEDHLQQRF